MRISDHIAPFKPPAFADLPPLRPEILEQFLREQRFFGLWKVFVERKNLTENERVEFTHLRTWIKNIHPDVWLPDEI